MEKWFQAVETFLSHPILWGVIALLALALALSGRLSVNAAVVVLWVAWAAAAFGVYRALVGQDLVLRWLSVIAMSSMLAIGAVLLSRWYVKPEKPASTAELPPTVVTADKTQSLTTTRGTETTTEKHSVAGNPSRHIPSLGKRAGDLAVELAKFVNTWEEKQPRIVVGRVPSLPSNFPEETQRAQRDYVKLVQDDFEHTFQGRVVAIVNEAHQQKLNIPQFRDISDQKIMWAPAQFTGGSFVLLREIVLGLRAVSAAPDAADAPRQDVAQTKEMSHQIQLLAKLRHKYVLSHDNLSPALIAGLESPPDDWINTELRKSGATWYVKDGQIINQAHLQFSFFSLDRRVLPLKEIEVSLVDGVATFQIFAENVGNLTAESGEMWMRTCETCSYRKTEGWGHILAANDYERNCFFPRLPPGISLQPMTIEIVPPGGIDRFQVALKYACPSCPAPEWQELWVRIRR